MQKLKRIWSAIICFLLAAVLCIFEIVYTTSNTNELYEMITKAREEFDGGNGDIKKTSETLSKARELWREKESIMNMFLYHDRIDDVGTKIECAKSLAESNNAMADAEMLEALSTLSTMKKLELPTIENIF